MILLIDNYDSFTYNLVHYFMELGQEVKVVRNDAMSAEQALSLDAAAIVISPGPCDPNKAGICLDLIKQAPETLPILGVCLGHQAIGQAFGGQVVQAKSIMHGKSSPIEHDTSGLFSNLPDQFEATRYHSLIVESSSFPEALRVTATLDDGVIMGLEHKIHPIFGVQFHPEFNDQITKAYITERAADIDKEGLDSTKLFKAVGETLQSTTLLPRFVEIVRAA